MIAQQRRRLLTKAITRLRRALVRSETGVENDLSRWKPVGMLSDDFGVFGDANMQKSGKSPMPASPHVAQALDFAIMPISGCAPDCQERAECDRYGELGHFQCGMCPDHKMPRHHCFCLALEVTDLVEAPPLPEPITVVGMVDSPPLLEFETQKFPFSQKMFDLMSGAHQCDERCVCPLDGKRLFYHRPTNTHACSLPGCANAHGLEVATMQQILSEAIAPRCTCSNDPNGTDPHMPTCPVFAWQEHQRATSWPGNDGSMITYDPTYGRIDRDIQWMIDDLCPMDPGQRAVMEGIYQDRRDQGLL